VKKLLSLIAGAAGLAGLAVGTSACNPVTPYAAVVNGTTISTGDINSELQALSKAGAGVKGQGAGNFSTQAASQVLSRQIDFVVLGQELARRHVTITSADLAAARSDIPASGQFPSGVFEKFPKEYQDVLVRRQAEITALAASIAGVDISPAGIAAYAAAHPGAVSNVCAQWITVPDLAAAATVVNDLKAGKSFTSEAQAKSTDGNTKSSGGQLGCHAGLLYTQLGAEVEQAVTTIPLGQVSPPVLGTVTDPNSGTPQQSLAIVEVTSRSPLAESDAATAVRQQLTGDAQNAVGQAIEPVVARAAVTLDARYGHWVTSSSNGPEVVAPAAPKVRSG
jgi:hypothetical protein